MYQIDELTHKGYKYVFESENLMEIDKVVFKLTNNKIPCRVLHDEQLVVFLDGTIHQYMYWKNQYVRDNKIVKKLERLKR